MTTGIECEACGVLAGVHPGGVPRVQGVLPRDPRADPGGAPRRGAAGAVQGPSAPATGSGTLTPV